MTWVLGVTGCVGAGKSTVSAILATRGWVALDVDEVAATGLDRHVDAVRALLPEAVGDDGAIAKHLVLSRMFRDQQCRAQLEELLLPTVRAEIAAWRRSLSLPGVLDAALLFEAGLDRYCDETLLVTCPRAVRRARVAQRATASAAHFEAIETAQWSEALKATRASRTLSSDCDPAEFERRLGRSFTF